MAQDISPGYKFGTPSLMHSYCINRVDLDATSLLRCSLRHALFFLDLLFSALCCVLPADLKWDGTCFRADFSSIQRSASAEVPIFHL